MDFESLSSGYSEKFEALAFEKVGETPQKREECLEKFRTWLKASELDLDTNNIRSDDEFLLRFLRVAKFDLDKAIDKFDRYVKARNSKRADHTKISSEKCEEVVRSKMVSILPRNQHGEFIGLETIGLWDPSVLKFDDAHNTYLYYSEICLNDPELQVCGIHGIFDYRGFSWRHAFAANPRVAIKIVTSMLAYIPARVKGLHVLNSNPVINALTKLAHSFLPEKIKNVVHFHGNDLSSLHKVLSPEYLPPHLGGTAEIDPEETIKILRVLEQREFKHF